MGVDGLELAAMAAYGVYAISTSDRVEMPPWEALPPDARADWRAVADAVLMVSSLRLRPDGEPHAGDPVSGI